MVDGRNEDAKSRLRVTVETLLLLLGTPATSGAAVALLAGTEHVGAGVVVGGVVGFVLARLRRDVYGAVGR